MIAADRVPPHQRVISNAICAFHASACSGSARQASPSFHSWGPARAQLSPRGSLSNGSPAQWMHRCSPLVCSAVAEAGGAQAAAPLGLPETPHVPGSVTSTAEPAEALDRGEDASDNDPDSERRTSHAHASTSDGAPDMLAGPAGGEPSEGGGKVQLAGAFQRLSMVQVAKEHLSSAQRRAMRVGVNKKLKNEAQQARNKCGPASPPGLAQCSL